jgi:tetratricopeptide (TPR) repeat protein
VVNAYSHREVARILRISPARLRYWERTALVRPSVQRDARAAFGFRDLVGLRGVVGLLQRGVPLRRIRRSLRDAARRLPEMRDPLAALRLWDERSRRLVLEHEGGLFEADGQMLLDFRAGPRSAEPIASLAERNGPTAAEWFERGCALDGDPASRKQAIEAYQRALALDPEHADAHCNLGTVHYAQGRRSSALACFRRTLEIDPLHLEANFNLANLLEERGEDELALRYYRTVLRVDPQYADAHVNLALLCEKLGLRLRAREHWRRYLQIEPGGAFADLARGHLEG